MLRGGSLDLSDPQTVEALAYWSDKGCVRLVTAWGGSVTAADVTAKGRYYFHERRQLGVNKWRERAYGFVSGVALSVLSGLAIKWLAG